MFLGHFCGSKTSAALAAGICLMYMLQGGDCVRVATAAGHLFLIYISTTDQNQELVHCVVLGLSE